MISAASFQAKPATNTFVAGPHWEQYTFTFERFGLSKVECLDVRFVAFAAGPKPGSFAFNFVRHGVPSLQRRGGSDAARRRTPLTF